MVTEKPWAASMTAATAGSGASPMPMKAAAPMAAPVISEGSRPSRRVSSGFTRPPATLPTATAASRKP